MHARGPVDLSSLPIAAVGPIIDAVFGAFGLLPLVLVADRQSVELAVRHIGFSKLQVTLYACLARELVAKAPGRYEAVLLGMGTSEARIRISIRKRGGA